MILSFINEVDMFFANYNHVYFTLLAYQNARIIKQDRMLSKRKLNNTKFNPEIMKKIDATFFHQIIHSVYW
jgi:hypothetical protein